MPAGRPLEPAGDGRPRWMAAARALAARGTEPGVQVDSSVAIADSGLYLGIFTVVCDLMVTAVVAQMGTGKVSRENL